ncbi:hypothetical protein WSM22_35420 [Cytophagales bacterium WSM2-2]|nr:hypothetical protein WSM22_35420 [Cytophagales bacterium WSM2-2]
MKTLIPVLLIVISKGVVGQIPGKEYTKWVRKAEIFYHRHDYKGSALAYSLAFKTFGWRGYEMDRYNAACSWALASVPDSAFANLQRIANKTSYSNVDEITNDKDFAGIHGDPRWMPLIDKIRKNKEKEGEKK